MNVKSYLKLIILILTLTSYCCAAFIDTIARNHTDRQDVYNRQQVGYERQINDYTNDINAILSDESKVDAKRGASQAEKEKIATAVFGAAWTDLMVVGGQLTPDAMIADRRHKNPYNFVDGCVHVGNAALQNHFQILYWLDTLARFVVQDLINKQGQVIDADYLNQFDGYNSLSNLYSFAGFEKQTIAGWLDSVHESHKIGLNTRKAEAEVNLAELNLTKQNKAAIAIQRLGRGHLVRSEIKKHHLIAQEKAARAAHLVGVREKARMLLGRCELASIEKSEIIPELVDAFCEIAEQEHPTQRFDAAIMLLSDMIEIDTMTAEVLNRGRAIARKALTEIAERASARDYNPNKESINPLFAAYILNHYPMAATDAVSTGGDQQPPFNLLRFRDEKNKLLILGSPLTMLTIPNLSIHKTNIEMYECFNVMAHSTHRTNENAACELLYCLCDPDPFRYFASAKVSLETMKRTNILNEVAAAEILREKTPFDDNNDDMPFYDAIKIIRLQPQLYPLMFDAVIAISLDQDHPKWDIAIKPGAQKGSPQRILISDLHIHGRLTWRLNPMNDILRENSAILDDDLFYRRYVGYAQTDGWRDHLDTPSVFDEIIKHQIMSGPVGKVYEFLLNPPFLIK